MDFNEVKADALELATMIKSSNFTPDFIVGIARGGWVPTRLLSEYLSIKKILSVGITYTDKDRRKLSMYSSPSPFPRSSNILIVEDCLESGRSMEYAVKEFESSDNKVKSACLYVTDEAVFKTDYYTKQLPCVPSFPWEK
ncbi:MAG: phosphoribosyltransferase family protein [Pseudomonadota bacterium]